MQFEELDIKNEEKKCRREGLFCDFEKKQKKQKTFSLEWHPQSELRAVDSLK